MSGECLRWMSMIRQLVYIIVNYYQLERKIEFHR